MVRLIDTHQHLLFPNDLGYAWTARVPPLANQSFGHHEYAALIEGTEIAAAIFMEVDVDEADIARETRHVAQTMAGTKTKAIIAACRPEEDEGFGAWLEEASALGAVGFRRVLHVVDDAISQSETFRRNVRTIGDAGKTFDIVMHARQLPLAEALARACGNTQFVLDHCGNPDIAANGFDAWAAGMAKLADLPNVVVKFSGLTVNCGPGQNHEEVVQPYLDHMVGLFGPDRVLWGSDWPVVNLAVGLRDWVAISQRFLQRLSDDEARAIGHRTAMRVYGLTDLVEIDD
ncbi:MAG: amidohydrolase family protein [Devosiaceae bacterium]|nr:amidohydrolase family protein [Devosiaceae bacterium MH13]